MIEYDTPHKEFRLPSLTLQPVVENAIKHGMDPEHAPLCISFKPARQISAVKLSWRTYGNGLK